MGGAKSSWRAFVILNLLTIGVAAMPAYFLTRIPSDVLCIDLRAQRDDLSYFIIVNSRDGLMASHTWVTWQWNSPGVRTPTYQSFGFYANIIERAQAVLHPPGEVLNETDIFAKMRLSGLRLPDTRTAIVFYLDQSSFEQSRKILDSWQAGKVYDLFSQDCVSFVSELLTKLGLQVPARIFAPMPHAFIRAVIEMNSDDNRVCKAE
ncbi:hypothetical protein [Bradyrhizobium sp. 144]|uniref:hypothetical protein n=1 Tax=Bradyrhizobium sp. 144 TaxID=2782620 RepID=UPI001FF97F9D|nr:hypothetical protein [Bradyrhizobium sp. 144]MCK1695234.1 hypothetical protein [Bradyrhizobium sp. 144]